MRSSRSVHLRASGNGLIMRTALAGVLATLMAGVSMIPPASQVLSPIAPVIAPPIQTAQAAGTPCSNFSDSYPQLTGFMSGGTGTLLTNLTTNGVYGRISNVDQTWHPTYCYAYRYDAFVWATSNDTTHLTVNWGALSGDGNACRYQAGTADYLHANAGACPAPTTARLVAALAPETLYHNNAALNSIGEFAFAHSDCYTWYGATKNFTGNASTSGTSGKPGVNCGNKAIDNTGTSQGLTYDRTAPTGTSVSIAGGAAYTATTAVTLSTAATDTSGVAPVTLMRFSNDNVNWSAFRAYASSASWTLTAGDGTKTVYAQYQDLNGNTSGSVSDTIVLDATPPTGVAFSAPPAGTTTVNAFTYAPTWTASDPVSGIASSSLQRQIVGTTSACSAGPTPDGAASSSASGTSYPVVDSTCYQWVLTVTNGSGLQTSATSGKVWVNAASPEADFTTPDEGTTTFQNTTTYSVAWAETAGSGLTITSRSLQQWKGAPTGPNTCPASPAPDGTAQTNVSPLSPSPAMVSGSCYRWVQTLTNSASKTGATTSGWVFVDTVAPTGSISTPAANAPLSGDIVIRGSADDAQTFQNYQLEYGAGATPASWTTIGSVSTSPVSNNVLGTWSPGSLSGVFSIRLTVRDNAGNTFVSPNRTIVLENAGRGDEEFVTRVPFDLGGGLSLDVSVANGEARVSRDLFSIPSYGPPQELGLTYSSLETGAAGKFGVGWVSNLTQYLTFDVANNIVTWHQADGGRAPFGLVAGVWTPLAGHHEVLGTGTGVYTISLKDQTKLTFESTGPIGRLTQIDNRFGKHLTLAWGTSSATATDDSGRATTLTIDSVNNRITAATDSGGRVWAFGYTGTDLTSITEPDPDLDPVASTDGPKTSALTTFGYDVDGSHHLTTITRTRTRVAVGLETLTWTVGYAGGKATSVSDAASASTPTTFTYNGGATDVTAPIDPLGQYGELTSTTSRYAFDGWGRVTALTQSPADGLIDGTDDQTTTTVFDSGSNRSSLTRPMEASPGSTWTYDAAGNVLTETNVIDASTTVVTANSYNATNDLLTRSEADTDAALELITKVTYDVAGHLTSIDVNCTSSGTTLPAPPSSCTGAGTQDATTNLITNYAYTAKDQLAAEQDPLGRVILHTYDTVGNELTTVANCTTTGTTPPSPIGSCTAGGPHDAQTNVTTSSAYSTAVLAGKIGLPTSQTDAVGHATSFTYDALGRQVTEVLPGETGAGATIPTLTKTTNYDGLGNTLTSTESWTPLGGGSASRATSHAYDLDNRESHVANTGSGVSTDTIHDAAGNAIKTTADGVETDRVFDGLGRRLSESIGGSADWHVYDGQGNETTSVTADGVLTVRSFTNTGWVVGETVGSGTSIVTTTHVFDKLGRDIETTVGPVGPSQTITDTVYDRPGRATRVTVAGKATNTAYDRAGNATSVTDSANILTTTVYDPLNRVTSVIVNDVATKTLPTEDVTAQTFYDAAGTTIATTDPKGITTRTIPNVRGLGATSIANCTDSGTTPTTNPAACVGAGTKNDVTNVFTTAAYDGEGATITTIQDSFTGGDLNLKTETAMDTAGRVQAVRDPMGTVTRTLYTGDKIAQTIVNCTNMTSPGLPTGDWWECLPSALNDGTWNLTTTNAYDAAGNKVRETVPNGRVTTYEYDNVNRLRAQVVNDVASPSLPTEDVRTAYFYDDAGRQAAILAPAADGSHLVVTRSLYDTAGRLVTTIANCTNSGTTFDWNNELAGACTGAGTADAETNVVTSFAYDTAGNRIRLTEPDPSASSGAATVTTQYAYDSDNRLCRVVQNALSPLDIQALAHPCVDAISGGTATANVSTRYTYDGAGNVASMVDAANHTTLYAYDAAGHPTSTTDPEGKTVVFAYNGLGQKIRQENRSDPQGTGSVTWTFDGGGRIATRTYGPSVDAIVPSTPTGLTASAIAGNRVNLAWSASTDNVGVTKYTIRRSGVVVTTVSGSVTAFSDFSVAGSTAYSYTVDAADAAGNVSGLSTVANATTPAPATTVTTLSAIADSYVDGTNGGTKNSNYGTQVTLSVGAVRRTWLKFDASGIVGPISLARVSVVENTGLDGLSSVRSSATTSWTETGLTWNTEPAYGGTSLGMIGSNTNLARTYLTVSSTVTAPGVYSFVLVTTGTTSTTYYARNNGTSSAPQLEITSPPVDGTAPSTPTGLTAAAAGPTRINLSWSASTDAVGVQGYRIYRNGSLLTTVGSTSWSDLGRTGGTGYTYTVAAVDAAGNASSQSTSAGATTSATSATTTYTCDLDGNKLTASDGTLTITATYDRLNRPLTVDDEDAGTTPDTTYTYSLANPSWTDPTGTYLVTLDKLDHATSVDGPAIAAITTAYRSDGQVAFEADPNGNTTAFSYDHLGRETLRSTTAGAATPAALSRTHNRAGQVLSESSTIAGDPTNGLTTYTYDPLARLTGYTGPSTSTTYGWDAVPNRISVKVGAGTPTTTAFTAANRPVSDSLGGTYTADGDGRLTSQPGQRLIWDNLGRLTAVYPATGMLALAFYAYDPLDRLRLVDYGAGSRVRFRYVGLTTSVAQTIDDQSGSVLRNIGTAWGGERMLDWTGTNSNIRYYGTNAHHDTVWTASSTGTVSATARYDPFGTLTNSTGTSLPDFRFQGSWFDASTSLQWVVTRWYAPALGRFISEDSVLGTPTDPPSRHLYAYAAGEPVGRLDPTGTFWYKVKRGDTLWALAARYLHKGSLYTKIYRLNRSIIKNPNVIRTGWCLWIPASGRNRCIRPPETDTGPTPAPGPAPDACQQHPEWCPKPGPGREEVFLNGIRSINTAGGCTSIKGGFFLWGQWDLCALKDTGGRRAIALTPAIGLELGVNAGIGASYLLSNGTNVADQYGAFDTWGGEIGLAGTVSVAFATGHGGGGQEIRNVEVAFSGGAALAIRTGWSYTLLWDSQQDMDTIQSMVGPAPWALADFAFGARAWLLQVAKDAV